MNGGVIGRLRESKLDVKIMEVCGTHTSAIVKNGIRGILPDSVRLVSGPGCPVCVTPAAIIDGLVACSFDSDCTVLSFGDMFRVTGNGASLSSAKAEGGDVRLMYSPFDVIPLALGNPNRLFIIAAVGFETTAPVYAALIDALISRGIDNVRLYMAVKTMPEILGYICDNEEIDAFICPGHVSVIIGERAYDELFNKYKRPFVIAGFNAAHILSAISEILNQIETNAPRVRNLYPSVVSDNGQEKAKSLIDKYFIKTDSVWRGIGKIANSGYMLRPEYSRFSATDSIDAENVENTNPHCRCADVIMGRINPANCPMFGFECTPQHPEGPCMVSGEGACGIHFRYGTKKVRENNIDDNQFEPR